MSKEYEVTFWRKATQDDRYRITVKADSPEAATKRVTDYFNGEIEITEEERESEYLSKEFVDQSWFDRIDDEEPPRLLTEEEAA